VPLDQQSERGSIARPGQIQDRCLVSGQAEMALRGGMADKCDS
jgi:hypothetical protein